MTRASSEAARSGRRAEHAVVDYLRVSGFRVLATNLRQGQLELDVVAKKGGLVVVVEVRTRGAGAFVSALGSVSIVKRRHLLLAAERLWRTRLVKDATVERVRIDVAAVAFTGTETRVEYIEGAVVGAG